MANTSADMQKLYIAYSLQVLQPNVKSLIQANSQTDMTNFILV